jgi:hypothetical protein
MNPIVWPAIVEVGFITWRSMTGTHYAVSTKGSTGPGLGTGKVKLPYTVNTGVKRPPLPSELLAVMLAFGIFGAIAEKDARIGGLLAWGIVLSTGIIAVTGNKAPEQQSAGTFPPGNAYSLPNPPVPGGVNYPPQGGR